MANTSDIKNGSVILHKGKRMKVIEFLHVKPGKGPAFVRTKLKDISTGKIIDETLLVYILNKKALLFMNSDVRETSTI